MSSFLDDVKHSLRMFLKNPGFAIAAVAALTLGIGANTAIFSVVNSVLLKPLAYPDADRIVRFVLSFPHGTTYPFASIPEFHHYQQQTTVFSEVAAYDFVGPGFNLTGDHPVQIHGIHVTAGYFHLFGAPVILGRTFTLEEDSPNGPKVAVLSYGLWQRRFGGDPNIIGRAIPLSGEAYSVVGVLGKSFASDPQADIWVPFQFPAASASMNSYFRVAGRLGPGISIVQANAQLKIAAEQFLRQYPQAGHQLGFRCELLRDSIVGDVRESLLVMLGAVSLVLLIACANVANLLLVRATARRREFAIRAALGAGRLRIIGQLLTESMLLSVAGGILGLIAGILGVRALLAVSPAGLPLVGENGSSVGIDWRVMGFTVAVSLVTGVAFGLFPAFAASRANVSITLKEGSNRSGTGFRQDKARSLLVVSEILLALVLLIGSGLLIRTFAAIHQVPPGFDQHNVLTLEMSLSAERFHKTSEVAQLSRDGRNHLNALPGIEASAAAYWLPIRDEDGLPFQIVGRPAGKQPYGARWMSVSPGYLQVFHIPVLRGRGIGENDSANTPGVVLINEAMAKQYWRGSDPVGQQILIGVGIGPEAEEPPRQIVGVVANFHDSGLIRPPDPMMIVPIAQVTDGYTQSYDDVQPLIWAVRTHGDPSQAISAVSEELRLASGGLPVAHVRTMDEIMGRSTAREGFNMLLLTIFGVIALALAAVGIYGLLAYSVQQRTQEMGIRMALGADRSAIRSLVMWHGMKLLLVGTVLGVIAAFGLTRLLASLLFGVKSWDPAAFFLAPVIIAAVAFLAVWLPARRASRVDLIQALRAE
jgi:putative ABC transport system permease protein